MTINAEDRDMVYPGNAPTLPQEDIELTAPDNGLGTLRKQIGLTRFLTGAVVLSSLLSMPILLLFTDSAPKTAVMGCVFILLLPIPCLMLSTILTVVYSIRGGTLDTIDIWALGVNFFTLLPSLTAFVYLFVALMSM